MRLEEWSARRPGALVFDLDGTLIDSGRDIALAANHARECGGLPPLPADVVLSFVGDVAPSLISRVLAATGSGRAPRRVSEAEACAGLEAFHRHYAAHLVDHTTLYPGVRETLASFAGVPMAVATNKPAAYARPILARLGVAALFRRIVAAEDTARRKPDPAHLAACVEGLDVRPGEVVVVGDSRNDILAARAWGGVAVGALYGLTPPAALRAAGPDFVIARFDDLLRIFAAPEGNS